MQARPNILYIYTHDIGLAGAVANDVDGLSPLEQPMPVANL